MTRYYERFADGVWQTYVKRTSYTNIPLGGLPRRPSRRAASTYLSVKLDGPSVQAAICETGAPQKHLSRSALAAPRFL
jgi:hypothetical protein